MLSIGPTTIWCTSAVASLQIFSSCPMAPSVRHGRGRSGRPRPWSGRHPGKYGTHRRRGRPGSNNEEPKGSPGMNFAFSDEQEELRTAVRRFLAEKSPETEVRRLMDTTEGYDPAVWSQMADQLGLQSLTIPEEFGGSGFTLRRADRRPRGDGRRAAVRAVLLDRGPGRQRAADLGRRRGQEELLPGIASGETIATLAITEDNGKWDFSGIELQGGEEGRRLGARRPQDVRHRRAHGQPHRRGGADTEGRVALRGPG